MPNDRGSGRKPKISDEQIESARERRAAGESVASIAAEYGVSRQALDKRLKAAQMPVEVRIDHVVDGELCSSVFYDCRKQHVRVINYVSQLSKLAFGYNTSPDREDLQEYLDDRYLRNRGIESPAQYLFEDRDGDAGIFDAIPVFTFSRKDRVIHRTDTDGYQMKALTHDRRLFIKSQAVISGVALRDWAVEVIATDICRQLSIPCIEQKPCQFVYEGRSYDGVYSRNFELDGYTFISFERLIERHGLTSRDDDFISLGALDKLKWCAMQLSEAGALPYDETLKYMTGLAVLDCMVGNIDRHTRNFGLFFNTGSGAYEIPPVFDNGMGLFENDPYRDRYESFDEAMRNVYVSPYGEDPFDMLRMLDEEFDLKAMYPGIDKVVYPDILHTPYALEYERRILEIWQK